MGRQKDAGIACVCRARGLCSGDLQDPVTQEGCGELAAAIQHSWAVQPKAGFTNERLSRKFFLGLLDEHSNLFQLLLDLPDTAVQQLQLWFCSV